MGLMSPTCNVVISNKKKEKKMGFTLPIQISDLIQRLYRFLQSTENSCYLALGEQTIFSSQSGNRVHVNLRRGHYWSPNSKAL